MKKRYFGITIGPIYKTMTYGRKTRELWAASYLFSYLMKRLISKLKNEGAKVIMPFADEQIVIDSETKKLFEDKYEAGLFPDRTVFTIEGSLESIGEIVISVKDVVVEKVLEHLEQHQNNLDKIRAKEFLDTYLQVYSTVKEFDLTNNNVTNNTIIAELFATLDILELHNKIPPPEPINYMYQFLTTATFKKGKGPSFLLSDAKVLNSKDKVRFSSIIELAADGLIEKLEEQDRDTFNDKIGNKRKDDESLIDFLKSKTGSDFITPHKYIAIVHIDGDNFGKLIKRLNNKTFEEFSEKLTVFSLKVNDLVEGYGGMPVYVGGDDALFFAPVRTNKKTIFTLLDEIDNIFHEQFAGIIAKVQINVDKIIPSLSAGISITYYKYPLAEALENSRNLLFKKAKKLQGIKNLSKNAVAIEVVKHSGQSFSVNLHKLSKTFSLFLKMLNSHLNEVSKEHASQFFTSVIYHLERDRLLLKEIYNKPERIDSYFKNVFNEPFHTESKGIQGFLEALSKIIPTVYEEYPLSDDVSTDTLYGILRMIKFLNQKDNE